jgi:hypothetical protein
VNNELKRVWKKTGWHNLKYYPLNSWRGCGNSEKCQSRQPELGPECEPVTSRTGNRFLQQERNVLRTLFFGSFYGAASISIYRESNVRINRSWTDRGIMPEFAWRDYGKP